MRVRSKLKSFLHNFQEILTARSGETRRPTQTSQPLLQKVPAQTETQTCQTVLVQHTAQGPKGQERREQEERDERGRQLKSQERVRVRRHHETVPQAVPIKIS